jgi:hypothetical protein
MSWSVACSIPGRSPKVTGSHRQQQPGAGNGALVVKGDLDLVQHDLRGRIEKVSSSSRIMAAWQPPLSLVRGPCSQPADHHRASDSVDRG